MKQTRGAIGFITESGEKKISYNNYDSYEEGLGAEIARFLYELTEIGWWKVFEDKVKIVELLDEEQSPSEELQLRYRIFSDLNVGEEKLSDTYCLLRKVQGIDGWIQIRSGNLEHMIDANDFIKDSLFCEFGYILNFKDKSFDFYKGFQQSPQKDNMFGEVENTNGYYPCALAYRFKFDDIKRHALETDLSDFIGWFVETMLQSDPPEDWKKVKIQ